MPGFSNGFDSTEMDAGLPLYTSRLEIESIWSTLGVDLRIDDDKDGVASEIEEGWLVDAMEEATDTINGYASQLYEPTDLATVRRIRRWASYLGAAIISKRRGNPGAFCDEVEAIMLDLRKLMTGEIVLPGLRKLGEHMPAMSNFSVNRNFRQNPLRVDEEESVGDNPKAVNANGRRINVPWYW